MVSYLDKYSDNEISCETCIHKDECDNYGIMTDDDIASLDGECGEAEGRIIKYKQIPIRSDD